MPSPQTHITLIRHGETDWNADIRIQGHLDIPLNPAGIAQAAALAKRFATDSPKAIYSSDLERAYRTACHLASRDISLIRRDPRLRERHLGVLQGLTRESAAARFPQSWEVFTTRDPGGSLEAGETLRAFQQRVTDVLLEIAEKHCGEHVWVITHGGVLDIAYRLATGLALEARRDFPIGNASVNVVLYSEGRWWIKRWGDVEHLGGLSNHHAPFIDSSLGKIGAR